MNDEAFFSEARRSFHAALLASVLRTDAKGVPSNADKHSQQSVRIAVGILKRLGANAVGARLAGQMAGSQFEEICKQYLEQTFPRLAHLRPGQWEVSKGIGGRAAIAQYDQYEHLAALEAAAKANPALAAALGSDYLIKPDVVVIRFPEQDSTINTGGLLVDDSQARHTPLRRANSENANPACQRVVQMDDPQRPCTERPVRGLESGAEPQGPSSPRGRGDRRTDTQPHRLDCAWNGRH